MSFRSKYHHVYMKETKDNEWFTDVKPKMNSWDSNYIAVSSTHVAFPYHGGGGAVGVFNVAEPGKQSSPKKINAHTGDVVDVAFSPFNDQILASSSVDGIIKVWNIPEGGLKKDLEQKDCAQALSGHYRKCGNIIFHNTANNVMASGSVDKTIKFWDIEKGEARLSIDIPNVPLHISWSKSGSTLAAVARDKKLYLIDPRAETPIVKSVASHTSPKGLRVIYCTNREQIITVGFDRGSNRVIKLWDAKNIEKPLDKKELDLSAGILMTFIDNDLGLVYLAGKGEGMIRYMDINTGKLMHINSYQTINAQRGLCALPKIACNTMDHEILKFYKLTQNAVVPVRVLFPRKSPMFQPDLFPDTPSINPANTADDFFEGEIKDPLMMNLHPDKRPSGGAKQVATFAKKKAKPIKKKVDLDYMSKEELKEMIKVLNNKIWKYEKQLKINQD